MGETRPNIDRGEQEMIETKDMDESVMIWDVIYIIEVKDMTTGEGGGIVTVYNILSVNFHVE